MVCDLLTADGAFPQHTHAPTDRPTFKSLHPACFATAAASYASIRPRGINLAAAQLLQPYPHRRRHHHNHHHHHLHHHHHNHHHNHRHHDLLLLLMLLLLSIQGILVRCYYQLCTSALYHCRQHHRRRRQHHNHHHYQHHQQQQHKLKQNMAITCFGALHLQLCKVAGSNPIGAIHLCRPQKITFLIPPVHMRPHGPDPPPPLWTSTHGRHEIHTALLKWLVR